VHSVHSLPACNNPKQSYRAVWIGLPLLVYAMLVASCGPVSATSSNRPAVASAPRNATPVQEPAELRPIDLRVKDFAVGAKRNIRANGLITTILGIRLVPAKIIFKFADGSGEVTAVINEQVTLKEGSKIELVGKYVMAPSPMYSGPGEPPMEEVFVVERYLALP
jgi:hypothetical protein